jgi:hypothetical protein
MNAVVADTFYWIAITNLQDRPRKGESLLSFNYAGGSLYY